MARIAFAWELGAELGHAMACATLARALVRRGHEAVFAFRELHQLDVLPLEAGTAVYQAPVSLREGLGAAVPVSWADLLLGCGYDDVDELHGLVAGWIEVLRASRAKLVVADYAPTALLAARVLGLKCVDYSNGFSIPPRIAPIPPFRPDVAVDPAAVLAREARALSRVNEVLARYGVPPLGALHEQLRVAASFLCTFPELDHYGDRPRSEYWGPRYSIEAGEDVDWPYGEGPRVLVYLRASDPRVDAMIDALIAHRCRVVAYLPGLDDGRRARLKSAQRRVTTGPVRLAGLLPECDLFVNHGGDVAGAALMHGVPQIVLPAQLEQLITAARIEQARAGLTVARVDAPREVTEAFEQALRERARMRQAAQAFGQRYAAFSPAEQERRIVARIEQVLAGSSA
jgi:UDP:flavonoid glycosyltransferase YjiC (YdhE family)